MSNRSGDPDAGRQPESDATQDKGGKFGLVLYLPLLFVTALVVYLVIWLVHR